MWLVQVTGVRGECAEGMQWRRESGPAMAECSERAAVLHESVWKFRVVGPDDDYAAQLKAFTTAAVCCRSVFADPAVPRNCRLVVAEPASFEVDWAGPAS